MEYYNFKEGLNSKGKLVTLEQLEKFEKDPNKDYYISIYKYNEHQRKRVEEKGTVAGIRDVTTDILVWDFDSANNPDDARQDVVTLAHRLVEWYNVDVDTIQCYYSGSKGFHVILYLGNTQVTPEQFKKATCFIAEGLKTFDAVVSDPARVIRLEYTKHPKTGLYKIPLHITEVDELTIDDIKEMAKDSREEVEFSAAPVSLPRDLFKLEEKKKKEPMSTQVQDEQSRPPKGWKDYKWSIAQGHFESGERHQALMVLAATCRALGYDKEQTYYMCKTALKKQARRTGQDEFPKEELWNNIIEESVFSDRWEGGQYSPKTNPWLKTYCDRMGFDAEEKEELPCVDLEVLTQQFTDYATNFEQNIIKTGITELDENVMFSTSTLNGLLGQPGSAKTTLALNFLLNTSQNGIPSVFLSLDMGAPIIYAKLVQKATGLPFKKALELFRTDPVKARKIADDIKNNYRNVGFNFKSGLTVSDIKDIISKQTESTGNRPRLLVIDYLECLAGPYSDATANAALIANQLKDLANEEEISILLLLQTQKHSTPDISDPLLSMKQIKGSSVIEQACSTVLTLWREGYNPRFVEDDKYISFAVVKNRFGSLWQGDFSWDPIRGNIRSLSEEEREEFANFKERKKQQRVNEAREMEEWGGRT
jgi:KaiC/GvpD/RAD55 family RecA-like ATPase